MKSYGVIELVTSPVQTFAEPLSLEEVKKYLQLPFGLPVDSEEDVMLEGFITAAREIAEILYGKELIRKQYEMSLDYFPCEEIELLMPLVSVDLIRYRNSDGAYSTLTENSGYVVNLARGLVIPTYGISWPSFTEWPTGAVTVQFTAGYSTDHPFWSNSGQRILVGMKNLISAWYNNRLPFESGNSQGMIEYAYTVSALFGFGSIPRIG